MPQYPEADQIHERRNDETADHLRHAGADAALHHHDNGNDNGSQVKGPSYQPQPRNRYKKKHPRNDKADPSRFHGRFLRADYFCFSAIGIHTLLTLYFGDCERQDSNTVNLLPIMKSALL
jgi:hypothetical protein